MTNAFLSAAQDNLEKQCHVYLWHKEFLTLGQ